MQAISRNITRRSLVGISAFLGVWYYALQVKGACGELTPMQCLLTPLSWAAPAVFGPLERWARPAPKADPARSPPVAVKQAPAPPPPAAAAPPSSSLPPATSTVPVDAKRQASAPAVSKQRNLTVINNGRVAVEYFWASACHINTWGTDRLRSDEIIESRRQRVFDLSDGTDNCCFDLRVRYTDGRQNVARNMDVCRSGNWTVAAD